MNRALFSAFKVASVYAIFAALWILFSDTVVHAIIADAETRALVQTYKGLTFVIVTAVLLFSLVLRDHVAIAKAHDIDKLTGLLSIDMFIRVLNNQIKLLAPNEKIVLGYLDIDNFKSINRTVGFERADAFLKDLAFEINGAVLPDSFVARLHADQFASFAKLPSDIDLDQHVLSFQSLFAQQAKRHNLDVTCSIGVAIYPDDGRNAKELMVATTEALQLAKRKKNAIQFHDKTLTEKAMQRRHMVTELKQAIKEQQLSVVYQPKYELDHLTVCGVEVLVRWVHPELGFISPDIFIPLAEDNGFSNEITQLVINKVEQELMHTNLLGTPLKHIAINVSAEEFNNSDEMLQLTTYIQNKSMLSPYIRIEITETATLTDISQSVEIIGQLQAHGLTFSIDDFGTGYTSLAMLKDLTVDEIKIDRSFVFELEQDQRSKTIVQAIIAMAQSFGINIVAEGIETENQLTLLQTMGCTEGQGYYLARPMPINDLVAYLQPSAKAQ